MGIMVSEVYEALLEAGASKERAKAAAESIPVAERLATQENITELKQVTTAVRAELKQDIADLRAELKQDIADLRAELKGDLAKLTTKVARLEWAIVAVLALLLKLVFFPPGS